MLKNHADVLAYFLDIFVSNEGAIEIYFTRGRFFYMIDAAQESRFARTAGA